MKSSAEAAGGRDAPLASVAVLTVNYGSHRLLAENLAPLSASAPDMEVVVCDNFTSDGERAHLRSLVEEHGWVLIESAANDGFAAGTNRAAAAALALGATHLLLLNPDARITSKDAEALAAAVSQDASALASPSLFDITGTRKAPARHLRLSDGLMTEPQLSGELRPSAGLLPWLSAACLMVSAEFWLRIGGMCEDYFLYWEDVEFSFRAWQEGGRLVIVEGARCVHDQGGTQRAADASTGRPDPKTPTFFYYWARNRLLFAERNLTRQVQRDWRRNERCRGLVHHPTGTGAAGCTPAIWRCLASLPARYP